MSSLTAMVIITDKGAELQNDKILTIILTSFNPNYLRSSDFFITFVYQKKDKEVRVKS